VRSEKDVPSLLQMIDTNVVKLRRLLAWLDRFGHRPDLFAVSTDKAANPSSLMGASKRLMEHVLFGGPAGAARARSARFANVAFSNGSLPQAFLLRLERRQPLAVPSGILRYFVSLQEAGEICTLAATAAPGGSILYPDLDPETALVPMTAIAEGVLRHFGLTAMRHDDADAARAAVGRVLPEGRYPLLVTPADTSGEKPFEEFVAVGETSAQAGFDSLRAVPYAGPPPGLEDLLDWLEALVGDGTRPVGKAEIAARIARAIPGFGHVETGRSLDERP
jgi:FlaA1/EpsC-like NDP-sugar epimerase